MRDLRTPNANMDSMNPNAAKRIDDLEASIAHQQREYELLNQVVIEQADLIDKLKRRVDAMEASLKSVESRLPEDVDLVDEKPPHY